MKNLSLKNISLLIAGIIFSILPLIIMTFFSQNDMVLGVIQGIGIGLLLVFIKKMRKENKLAKRDSE